jgi:hypothetical protein
MQFLYLISCYKKISLLLHLKMNIQGDTKIRRNSLTTLHSLPKDIQPATLERQQTVPHGFNVSIDCYFF